MPAAFQHLLLTRFNVRVFSDRGTDPDWLRHRLRFFERICAPAVFGQTTRTFDWLLFCDAATPGWALENLRTILGDDPRVTLDFVVGPETVERRRRAVAAMLRPETTHLITTRLDNDDGIARTFLETVQRQFAGQDLEYVNLPDGHTCFLGRIYRWRDESSPFLSLIERIDGRAAAFQTVMAQPHQRVKHAHAVRQVECGPAWLQMIHGQNVWNMVRGRQRPLAEIRHLYPEAVHAAISRSTGLWARREAWDYWMRRLAKRLQRRSA